MKHTIAAAALAVLLLCPAASAAQDLAVRVIPRAGIITPADYFYIQFGRFGLGPVRWTESWILATPTVGLTAEVEIGGSDLWIRGEVLRTIGGETEVVYARAQEPVGINPPEIARTYYYIPTDLTVGSVDLAFPTRFRLPYGIQPYFTGGIGGKRYTFDRSAFGPLDELPDDMILPQQGVTLMLNVGAGITVQVAGLTFDLLARDAISEYWERQQHDVTLLAGLTWTVWR